MTGPVRLIPFLETFFYLFRQRRSQFVHTWVFPFVRLLLPLPWIVTIAAVWLLILNGQLAEVVLRLAEEANLSDSALKGFFGPLAWGLAGFLLLSLNLLGYYLTNTSNRQTAIYGDTPKLYLDRWLRVWRHCVAFVCATAPLATLVWALVAATAAGPALKLSVGIGCIAVAFVGLMHYLFHRSSLAGRVVYISQILAIVFLVFVPFVAGMYLPEPMVGLARRLGPLTMTALELLAGFATFAIVFQLARWSRRELIDAATIWAALSVLLLLAAVAVDTFFPSASATPAGATADSAKARSGTQPSEPQQADKALAAWMAAQTADFDFSSHSSPTIKYPVYIVAAEGGGIYAATAAAAFLGHMRAQHPAFTKHLFAITGVSGGAVGAAVHSLATPRAPDQSCDPGHKGWRSADACDALAVLSQDHLSPVLSMVMPDLLLTLGSDVLQVIFYPLRRFGEAVGVRDAFARLVAPLTLEGKRACLLEASLSQQPYGREDCNDIPKSGRPTSIAGHWGSGSREHALLLTTTKMEEGEPVVFAPFTFAAGARLKTLNGDGVHPDTVSVIKAAVASARFPLVLPPYVVRKGKDIFNFVDGGYSDNSGAGIAGRLLSHLKNVDIPAPKNPIIRLKPDIHIILITSDDGHRAAKPYFGSRIFVDFLVPFETMLNVRARIGPSEVADLLDTISERVSTIGYGESNIFLGWTISARTLDVIKSDVTGQTAGACPTKSNRAHPLCNGVRIRDIEERLKIWNNELRQRPTPEAID